MTVRVDAPKNPEYVVMTELQVVLLAHLLNAPSHVSGRDEEVEHRLLGPVLKGNCLLDVLP
jgi:hypothetical protein